MLLLTVAWLLALSPIQAARSATFDPQEYAGKVVVLDFWASWCVPCRRSFPWLNTMQEKYGDEGLVIVGINLDMERAEAGRFLAEFPADFRIVYDDGMVLARRFEVMAMPSSYVIGRDGEVVAEHLGFKVKKQDEYEAVIRQALGMAETPQ
jgi:thiol-disulfide isomerase/thioredoxin